MRGDIVRLRAPRAARGSEQRGHRYAVILQSDDLPLSTLLVAPTSRSARPRSYRPTISVRGEVIQVLVEQIVAVAPERLGDLIGHASRGELDSIDRATKLVFALD